MITRFNIKSTVIQPTPALNKLPWHVRMKTHLDFRVLFPPHPPSSNFFFKLLVFIYIYIWILILAIWFNKITFYPLKKIIDSFKSNATTTNFSIIFLQAVKVQILTSSHLCQPLKSFFLLTNHHSPYQQSVKKKILKKKKKKKTPTYSSFWRP